MRFRVEDPFATEACPAEVWASARRDASGEAFFDAVRAALPGRELGARFQVRSAGDMEIGSAAVAAEEGAALMVWPNGEPLRPTSRRIRCAPDSKGLTRKGETQYAVSEGRMTVTYMLAELVDNSLRAIQDRSKKLSGDPHAAMSAQGTVCINFHLGSQSGFVLSVDDDGVGMAMPDLQTFATAWRSQEDRGLLQSFDLGARHPVKYLSGHTSYYGVGGKAAGFGMCKNIKVISKKVGETYVAELVLDQDALERNTAMGADEANKWSFPVVSRKLGCKENLSEVERACVVLANAVAGEPELVSAARVDERAPAAAIDARYTREDIDMDVDVDDADSRSPATQARVAAARWSDVQRVGFTRIILSDPKKAVPGGLADPRSEVSAQLVRDLAQVYHYYLHGPDGNVLVDEDVAMGAGPSERPPSRTGTQGRAGTQVRIGTQGRAMTQVTGTQGGMRGGGELPPVMIPNVLLRWYDKHGELVHEDDLRDIKTKGDVARAPDLETRYVRSACGDVCRFQLRPEDHAPVYVELRYYPFDSDRETMPRADELLPSMQDDDDDEMLLADGSRPLGTSDEPEPGLPGPKGQRGAKMMSVFWQGRFVPETQVDALGWMHKVFRGLLLQREGKDFITEQVIERIHGSIFVGADFASVDTKIALQDDLTRLLSEASVQTTPRNVSEMFKKWVLDCHREHDKVVKYTAKLPDEQQTEKGFVLFGKCSTINPMTKAAAGGVRGKTMLSATDMVLAKRHGKHREIVGEVVYFKVPGKKEHPKCQNDSYHAHGMVKIRPMSLPGGKAPTPIERPLAHVSHADTSAQNKFRKAMSKARPAKVDVVWDIDAGGSEPAGAIAPRRGHLPQHEAGYCLPACSVTVTDNNGKAIDKLGAGATSETFVVLMRCGRVDPGDPDGAYLPSSAFSETANSTPSGKTFYFKEGGELAKAGTYRVEIELQGCEELRVVTKFAIIPGPPAGFVVTLGEGGPLVAQTDFTSDRGVEPDWSPSEHFKELQHGGLGELVVGALSRQMVCMPMLDAHGNVIKLTNRCDCRGVKWVVGGIGVVLDEQEADLNDKRRKLLLSYSCSPDRHHTNAFKKIRLEFNDYQALGTDAPVLPREGHFCLMLKAMDAASDEPLDEDFTCKLPFTAMPGLPHQAVAEDELLACASGSPMGAFKVVVRDECGSVVSTSALGALGLAVSTVAAVDGVEVGTADVGEDGTASFEGAVVHGEARQATITFDLAFKKLPGAPKDIVNLLAEAKKGAVQSTAPLAVEASKAPARLALLVDGKELPAREGAEGVPSDEMMVEINDIPAATAIKKLRLRVLDAAGRAVDFAPDAAWNDDQLQVSWAEGVTTVAKAAARQPTGLLALSDIDAAAVGTGAGSVNHWVRLRSSGRDKAVLRLNVRLYILAGRAAQMDITVRPGMLAPGASQASGSPEEPELRVGQPFVISVAFEDHAGNPARKPPRMQGELYVKKSDESGELKSLLHVRTPVSSGGRFEVVETRWVQRRGGDVYEAQVSIMGQASLFEVRVDKYKDKRKGGYSIQDNDFSHALLPGAPSALAMAFLKSTDGLGKAMLGGTLDPIRICATDTWGNEAPVNWDVLVSSVATPVVPCADGGFASDESRPAAKLVVPKGAGGKLRHKLGKGKDWTLRNLRLPADAAPGHYELSAQVKRGGGADVEDAKLVVLTSLPNAVDSLGLQLAPLGERPQLPPAGQDPELAPTRVEAGAGLCAWVEVTCRDGGRPPLVEGCDGEEGASGSAGIVKRSGTDSIEHTQTLAGTQVHIHDLCAAQRAKSALRVRLTGCGGAQSPERPAQRRGGRRRKSGAAAAAPAETVCTPSVSPLEVDGRWFYRVDLPPLAEAGQYTLAADYTERRQEMVEALNQGDLEAVSLARTLQVVAGAPANIEGHAGLATRRHLACSDGELGQRVFSKGAAVRASDAHGNACAGSAGTLEALAWLEGDGLAGGARLETDVAVGTEVDAAGQLALVVPLDGEGIASFGNLRVAERVSCGEDRTVALVFALRRRGGVVDAGPRLELELLVSCAAASEQQETERRTHEAQAQVQQQERLAELQRAQQDKDRLAVLQEALAAARAYSDEADENARLAGEAAKAALAHAHASKVPNVRQLQSFETAQEALEAARAAQEAAQQAAAEVGEAAAAAMQLDALLPRWERAKEPAPRKNGRLDYRKTETGKFVQAALRERDAALKTGTVAPNHADAVCHGFVYELVACSNEKLRQLAQVLLAGKMHYAVVHNDAQKERLLSTWKASHASKTENESMPPVVNVEMVFGRSKQRGQILPACELSPKLGRGDRIDAPHATAKGLRDDEKVSPPGWKGCHGNLVNLLEVARPFPPGTQPDGKDLRVVLKAVVGSCLVFATEEDMSAYRKWCVRHRIHTPSMACVDKLSRFDASGVQHFWAKKMNTVGVIGKLAACGSSADGAGGGAGGSSGAPAVAGPPPAMVGALEAVVERFKQLDAARKDAEHARQELCEAEASADAAGATDAANGCGRGGKRRGGAQEAPAERGKRARR